jgi:tryptophan synthase alpha chain
MNRIDTCFAGLRAQGRTALIPFTVAGDPLPDAGARVMQALADAGADILELGMPFSDPMADGPVIQQADERALRQGVGIAAIFAQVRAFRQRDTDTPVVLMGYMNPVAVHGAQRFAREAADAGVDGVLVVDCPIDEDASLGPLGAAGLKRILLAAPTTSDARLARIVEVAEGYLYYVSFAGTTGAAKLSTQDIAARVADLRARARVPVAVGFGIRNAADAKAVSDFADAVVIGSALVGQLAGAASAEEACARARDFLTPIRSALDQSER